ncbi:MAG: glycosyltransferase [Candidatus Marinimicrobia bacterium]|nr:glycosyltransferase [Candidatus Neomarinimicrobiota bacterium]MBT7423693.1 glycosyltransferase [Candidatus Neomarinimicrobiota bacterium]
MDNSFSISVVIPTFNRLIYLERAIKSVLNQTISVNEIIIVDDGSDDGTSEFIHSNYPNLKYIFQSNSGVSAARNTGIKAASSNWIAFLDSDDAWVTNKIQKQITELELNPEMNFCHSNEIWIRNGREIKQKNTHKKFGGFIFDKCLDKCRISPSTVICRKSLLIKLNGFDEDLAICEDYDLWLRITSNNPVIYIEKPLIIKYGGHQDQLSRNSEGIESYHIKSLEKLLKQDFPSEHRIAMENMLINKLKIYANGAKKRGRVNIYNKFIKRIDELSYQA